jgi:DNA-directed RNA polymerase subunit RPC12/RpoP
MMALVHWDDTHMVDERGRPLLHEHRKCGKMFDPVIVCSECGEPLLAKEVHTHPVPVHAQLRQGCRLISPRKPEHASKLLDDCG